MSLRFWRAYLPRERNIALVADPWFREDRERDLDFGEFLVVGQRICQRMTGISYTQTSMKWSIDRFVERVRKFPIVDGCLPSPPTGSSSQFQCEPAFGECLPISNNGAWRCTRYMNTYSPSGSHYRYLVLKVCRLITS